MSQMDWLRPLGLWRDYQSGETHGGPAGFSLGIAASYTAESLIPFIGGALLDKGWQNFNVVAAPFNQIFQTCLDPESAFAGQLPDQIVIAWRLEDIFPGPLAESWQFKDADLETMCAAVSQLAQAVATLRSNYKGSLLVCSPPYPHAPGYQLRGLGDANGAGLFYRRILEYWEREMASLQRVSTLDAQSIASFFSYENAHDPRKWYLYRQPYSDAFLAVFGKQIARHVDAGRTAAKKCVVVDCDNTLWGGVLGELGFGGIALGNEFPGSAFSDFQRQLQQLGRNGVFLAIASKNNPEDVDEVFAESDTMILKREDISVFEVHWRSKVDSIRAIAQRLNIGLDSIVFVDDSAKEIGEVEERLPGVTCLTVPEDVSYLPGLLADTELFDKAEVTEEDRARVQMMAAEQSRLVAGDGLSEEEFKRSLGLKVKVFRVQHPQLARVTQLINKTNQFNLTTIRRTQDEVAALMMADDAIVLAMEVSDRFGDYGLVGVSILKSSEARTAEIDTLLMSCRVLGRGVETAFIASLGDFASELLSAKKLVGSYRPTAKNQQVADLYASHGFESLAGGEHWRLEIGDMPNPPDHIDLEKVP